jgi:hypothetical protein
VQLGWIVHCSVFGHDWSLWAIDDIDGPGEHFDDGGFMPYLSRPSRPGEFGTRSCRDCRAVETRWPLREMPPLFAGRMRVGER